MIVLNKNIQLEELEKIPLERPDNAGRFWKGVQHGELVNTMLEECRTRGWKVEEMGFSVSKDQLDLVGAFDLSIPDLEAPKGQRFSIGFITSNNRKRALKISVGSRVMVCHNGLVTGEIVTHKKHTIETDFFQEVEDGFDEYRTKIEAIPFVCKELMEYELDPKETDRVLCEAGRNGILPWSRIGQIDHEFRNPTYAEHDVPTSWGLLQAMTHIAKKSPAMVQMEQINKFRELLPTA